MDKFETWWESEGQEFLFALNTTTDDDIKLVAEIAWKNGAYCAEQATVNESLTTQEQEPVAIGSEWKPCMKLPVVVHVREQREGESHVSTREGITPVRPDDLIMRGIAGEEYPIGRELFNRTYTFDTAAPVRTKDLTDEEIEDAVGWTMTEQSILDCRAVIAADRRKNK